MPAPAPAAELEVLLPVHNEGASIAATLREIHAAIAPLASLRFRICEDGSRDDSKDVLRRLARELPLELMLSDERKGYSRAVVDGMRALDAPWLLCLDSDGQCDPADFARFWAERDRADVLYGWRVERADNLLRRALSRFFYLFYRALLGVPLHDPSCPFLLVRRRVVERIAPEMGEMQQGFWWEFAARVHRRGFSIHEMPVRHRPRAAGETQVYRLGKMPGIFWRHFTALFRIRAQTRR
jgi:dolichol-phosphate mannosyltransferase